MKKNIKIVARKAIKPALENEDTGSLSSPLIPIQITSVKNRKVAINAGLTRSGRILEKIAGRDSPRRWKNAKIESINECAIASL
jgi:hypothetical protein